jgi:hypothetical protein
MRQKNVNSVLNIYLILKRKFMNLEIWLKMNENQNKTPRLQHFKTAENIKIN